MEHAVGLQPHNMETLSNYFREQSITHFCSKVNSLFIKLLLVYLPL